MKRVEQSTQHVEQRAKSFVICKDCDGSCGDECELSRDDWVESDAQDVEQYLSEHGRLESLE